MRPAAPACFIQGGHGFDHQHVSSGYCQRRNLLLKGFARLRQSGFTQRLQVHAQRPHGAGDPGIASLLVFQMLSGLTCDADSSFVDLRRSARESVPGQPEAVGAKGICLQNLGAALQILFVNGKNQRRVGEVQFVITAVDEDAPGV